MVSRLDRVAAIQQHFAAMPTSIRDQFRYVWRKFRMRPQQDAFWEQDWRIRLWMTGRGWGKNRTAAEAVREAVLTGIVQPGDLIGLVGRNLEEAHSVMIHGAGSGLLAVHAPHERPLWLVSRGRGELRWPNGVIGRVYSAEHPDQLRGPNFRMIWADEVAAWPRLEDPENSPWDNMQMATRTAGATPPRILVTTTPRGSRFMRDFVAQPDVLMTVGSSYDNAANLSPEFIKYLREHYEGTRIGDQEIHARLLDEASGALFKRAWLAEHRQSPRPLPTDPASQRIEPPLKVVVGVDPAGAEAGAETGIVVCAMTRDRKLEVWDDLSRQGSPAVWAKAVIAACKKWQTNVVVAERNFGGDMVRHTLLTAPGGNQLQVIEETARQGKAIRAEPVAARFERGTARLAGEFPALEDQMTLWSADDEWSPDRLDALVWAMRHLDPQAASSRVPLMANRSLVGPSRHRLT